MRGEAVRSALRSPNGVCIDYTSTNQFGVGVVKVDGKGVQSFLEGKVAIQLQCGYPWGLAIIMGALALLCAVVRKACCRNKDDGYHHP